MFPIVPEAEAGETEILKSGVGGGGDSWFPPPHPASPPKRAATASDARSAFEISPVRITVSLPAPKRVRIPIHLTKDRPPAEQLT